jgi:hypothetical protein
MLGRSPGNVLERCDAAARELRASIRDAGIFVVTLAEGFARMRRAEETPR